jgi:hypothetical protein
MFSSTSTSTEAINVFDFEAIRIPPDFEREAGVRKQLTQVKVRKPRRQEWVRVHPEHRVKVATIVYKENDESRPEIYLVSPNVALNLGDEITYTTLYLAINRQGVVFLWPCRPRSKGRR